MIMTTRESVKKVVKKIFRIILTIILVVLGIILLILVLIQTSPVQNYGREKIEAWLENKLQTRVRIGNLYIGFPSRIILKNIYLEDRAKDTLISGGSIAIDISMFRLLSKELRVNQLDMTDLTLKLRRQMPDSVFNFQFISDAFSSGSEKKPEQTDTTAGFTFVLGDIHLHNIHFAYADDATGNDLRVTLGDFKTKIKTFDLARQHYAIPDIRLIDASGQIRQYKPILLLRKAADTISAHNQKGEPARLELGNIDFLGVGLHYRNDVQQTDAAIRLGHFHIQADSVDLASLHFHLKEIILNNTSGTVRLGKRLPGAKTTEPVVHDTISHSGNWSVDITRFTIDSSSFQFDDDNKQTVKNGMDFSHLRISHFRLHTAGLHADPSNYRALINGFSLDEQSGFVLKDLTTQLSYNSKGASVKNLVIRTPYSEIRNETSIQFRSLEEWNKNPGNSITNLEFNKSRVAVRDVLVFVPSLESPLKGNKQAVTGT